MPNELEVGICLLENLGHEKDPSSFPIRLPIISVSAMLCNSTIKTTTVIKSGVYFDFYAVWGILKSHKGG